MNIKLSQKLTLLNLGTVITLAGIGVGLMSYTISKGFHAEADRELRIRRDNIKNSVREREELAQHVAFLTARQAGVREAVTGRNAAETQRIVEGSG